jgi:hypothetical protein
MRSSRNLRRIALLFAGVLAVASVLRAQEPAQAPAEAKPAVPAGTGERPAPPQRVEAEPPAAKGRVPERFEPTEKVRADFDVSFPIDI